MHDAINRQTKAAAALLFAGILTWPALGVAQEVTGQGRAVQATVLGVTSTLADTGTLSSEDDARGASVLSGAISSLGTAETLHAATISSVFGWDSLDSVASEASLGNLDLGVAGNTINADLVMARALAPVSGSNVGTTSIDGLTINGFPVDVTGAANQTVSLVGGRIIINEQQTTPTGDLVINALHIIVDGVADVVLGSATAGVGSGSTSTDSGSSSLLDSTTSTLDSTTSTLDSTTSTLTGGL